MTQSGPLPWFRMYHEAVDDEKLRLLAFEDRWHYVAILCCKCKGILDSQSEPALRDRKISVKLGVHGRDLEEVKRRLMEAELINSDWQPLGWENRQSSDRPAAHEWRELRSLVFERDDFTCFYCGRRGVTLECDHFIPVASGGAHTVDNLVTACRDCNRSKRDKHPDDWFCRLKELH